MQDKSDMISPNTLPATVQSGLTDGIAAGLDRISPMPEPASAEPLAPQSSEEITSFAENEQNGEMVKWINGESEVVETPVAAPLEATSQDGVDQITILPNIQNGDEAGKMVKTEDTVPPCLTDDLDTGHDRISPMPEPASEEPAAPLSSEEITSFAENERNGEMAKWINGESKVAEAPVAAALEATSQDGFDQITILPNIQNGGEAGEMVKSDELPAFPDEVYDHLPSFLKECVDNAVSADDRDTILLGTLACVSACFHNVCGVYDSNPRYPNIYLFLVADAGMGKGALTLCREIVKPIDRELHEISRQEMKDYKKSLATFARGKGEDRELPEEPPMRMLIIPANSSASSFLKILSDNGGQGLMFETEGDTLSQALRSDYGNYSHVLREAFQHEQVSQSRRKDNEFFEISEPCLSVVLSGTPEQVRRLIPDAENGLFSRFCFYNIPFRMGIRNVFAISDLSLSKKAVFQRLGERFKREREDFMRRGEFSFSLPPLLQGQFTGWLRKMNEECCIEIDKGMQGVVRRLGLITFRLMMLLTIVRELGHYTAKEHRLPDGSVQLVCNDEDFHTAISIANVLIEHGISTYRKLASTEKRREIRRNENRAAIRRKRLYDVLPDVFTRKDYDTIVVGINENLSTAGKWIDIFIRDGQLYRTAQGNYVKIPQQETGQKQISISSNNQQQ